MYNPILLRRVLQHAYEAETACRLFRYLFIYCCQFTMSTFSSSSNR